MALVVGIGSLLLGANAAREQRKQGKAQEKATEKQGKIAEAQNARKRRKQVIESRRARAQTIAQGEAQGLSGGSQVAGAVGSIGSQAASNVSFLNQLSGLDQARFGDLQDANRAASRANTSSAIGGSLQNFSSFVQT